MNRRQRDLCLIFVSIILSGAIVSYFFRILSQGKQGMEIRYCSIFPERPEAVLQINDTKMLALTDGDLLDGTNIFERCIPSVFFNIIERSQMDDMIFCFYPQGILFFSRMSEHDAYRIKSLLRQLSDGYPPNKYKRDGVEIDYYKDNSAGFIGVFYKNGVCVSGSSSVLLEKSLDKLMRQSEDNSGIYDCLEKTSAKHPADLWLWSPIVDMEITLPDTDSNEVNCQWLHAELHSNDSGISVFTVLPFKVTSDSVASIIADTLRYKVATILQIDKDSIFVRHGRDDDDLYLRFLLGR